MITYEKNQIEQIFLEVLNKYFQNKTFTIRRLRKRIEIEATELKQITTNKLARKLNDLVRTYQKIGIERLNEKRSGKLVYKYIPKRQTN